MSATVEPRRLVVNADDFGMTAGINRGIMEAFEAGTVTSTSLMPTMPAFDDAVRLAHSARGRLGIGLHFTLTNGRPITSARSLTGDNGDFLSHARLACRALRGAVRAHEVEAECAAQIGRCASAGVSLTHLDGHHHAHTLPGIRDVVRDVARRASIRFVRHPRERVRDMFRPVGRLVDRALVWLLAGPVPRDVPGPRHADHFVGPSLFDSDRFEDGLLHLLDTLRPGTSELMVHPGYIDGPLPGGDPYTMARERELSALISPSVRQRVRDSGIELLHFGQL